MNKLTEILAPAGSKESLAAAVNAGADAVYVGGNSFGARAYAENFTEEELLSAIDYVHLHGRKIYLTVNTLLKEGEMPLLYDYLAPFYERGLDAVIVQDVGVMDFVRDVFTELPIHVSTQATVTGAWGAEFFKERGASRIIPARELSLEEIRKIKDASGLEIECFVHGALCYGYSGQCLLSSLIGGRSGNRGQCAQPCRLPYSAAGGKCRDIMSLKDLCAIDLIPDLLDAGVDSFKIEGRMKQPDYVYTAVSLYRKYLDLCREAGKENYRVLKTDREALQGIYRRRGYTDGYFKRHNGREMISFQRPEEMTERQEPLPEMNLKEKINGKLILSKGEHAKLYIESGGVSVSVSGGEVQESIRSPLDEGRVRKQMKKTGNTEFAFDCLEILMQDDIFLPMQALNELRREGILKLTEAKLVPHRREIPDRRETGRAEDGVKERLPDRKPELSVLASEERQLEMVFEDRRVDTVYIESELALRAMAERRQAGQKCFLAMPYVFRESAVRMYEKLYRWILDVFDGVLARNWETCQWLKEKEYPGEIRGDYNLYAYNRRSQSVLKDAGIARLTVPVELNCRELSELGVRSGSLIVYGRQPVMISAGCIKKSTGVCGRKDGETVLTDRKRNEFIVKNHCSYCYNVMYNCRPLLLHACREEVKRLGPAEVRIDFLNETKEEAERILGLCGNCFLGDAAVEVPDIPYTNGHFKRGVK